MNPGRGGDMEARHTRTTRTTAGWYVVHALISGHGSHRIDVRYYPHLRGWIAAAQWDRYTYTDQVATKRRAVAEAVAMLDDREKELLTTAPDRA